MSVDCQRQRAADSEANEQSGTDQHEDKDAGVIGSRARRLKSQLAKAHDLVGSELRGRARP
jgi:hypothetical protein